MKKPLMILNVELWESANDFMNYGIPWYMKLSWYLFNRKFYRRMIILAKNRQLFCRGFYDRFRDRVVLCINDLLESTINTLRTHGSTRNYHVHFGCQAYFTLVHEMLHKANVAKDDLDGHKIDFDKFDKLPEALKDIFDGLLELERSNDAFNNHPENRRKDNDSKEIE